ncbi:hypothetical protein [Asticcacaulis sp. 201]|uniref:hypothetical protein n=1 Tax=Asticcacaulis sp. 201 TaxID=3028787 RepID=UPI00291626CF|nr:hypothetical protein [Asticcacaulis sp. 201]MDV6331308.1 hypothetical protein [Asticcacaulis sp. 201]
MSERKANKPFTRIVNAPPGWPWDQSRVASLEAQHTSPVSGADVSVIVRRLEAWRPGQPAKFVAIYIRDAQSSQGIKFEVDVQGRKLIVELPSPQQRAAVASQRLWTAGWLVALTLSVFAMGALALQRRGVEDARLSELEAQMARKARQAVGVTRAKADAVALSKLDIQGHTIDNALLDLKHLSLKRDPAVWLDAFYWKNGYWAVEARGKASPVTDATVPLERSSKPVRKDVWLWVAAQKDGAQ